MNTFWSTCSINHNNHNSFVVLENQSHQSQSFGNQSHQSRSITKKGSTCFFNHNENFKLVYLSDLKYSRSKFDGVDFWMWSNLKFLIVLQNNQMKTQNFTVQTFPYKMFLHKQNCWKTKFSVSLNTVKSTHQLECWKFKSEV